MCAKRSKRDKCPQEKNVSNKEGRKKRKVEGRFKLTLTIKPVKNVFWSPLTALDELRPGWGSELWHSRGKRQRIIRVPGTPNARRPPHPLPPHNLDLGKTCAWDGRGKKFFNKLQLENVFAFFPTFGPFVCVDHLPTEIRAAPETYDFLDGVRPRGHQLNRGPIVPDIRSRR